MDIERIAKLLPDAVKTKDTALIETLLRYLTRNNLIKNDHLFNHLTDRVFDSSVLDYAFKFSHVIFRDRIVTYINLDDLTCNNEDPNIEDITYIDVLAIMLDRYISNLVDLFIDLFDYSYLTRLDVLLDPRAFGYITKGLVDLDEHCYTSDLPLELHENFSDILKRTMQSRESMIDFVCITWIFRSEKEDIERFILNNYGKNACEEFRTLVNLDYSERLSTYDDALIHLGVVFSNEEGSYLNVHRKKDKKVAWLGLSEVNPKIFKQPWLKLAHADSKEPVILFKKSHRDSEIEIFIIDLAT